MANKILWFAVGVALMVWAAALTHQPAAEKPVASAHRLAVEFQKARDLRVLFESLIRRQEPGAGLYALHILVTCGRLLEAPSPTGASESREQDAARQLLQQRCASFTKDEVSTQRTAQSLKDPRFKDRQRDLWNEWGRRAADPVKQAALQREILASNNPLLLEFVGPWMYYPVPRGESLLYPLNGKSYPQEQALLILGSAWRAAVCEGTNTVCGEMDMPVVENCAVYNLCVASRREAMAGSIRKQFGAEGVRLYDSVYRQMVEAIQSKRMTP